MTFCYRKKREGTPLATTATALGVKPRTLYDWNHRARRGTLQEQLCGRPAVSLTKNQRRAVLDFLLHVGPKTGRPTLEAHFPDCPPAALLRTLERFRVIYRRLYPEQRYGMAWLSPGVVWAMDNTNPPTPVDGVYRKILVVRDLGSHRILASVCNDTEDQTQTIAVLKSLFTQHGPPLVIKSDNHGAFTGECVTAFLQAWHVTLLRSPPYYPQFNGAIEAGMGGLKTRIHHHAKRNDRPHAWASDDVEAARLQGNELLRPWGKRGPTPDERWAEREDISDVERQRFYDAIQRDVERRIQTQAGKESGQRPIQDIMRTVIRLQLVQKGFLVIGRAGFTLPN